MNPESLPIQPNKSRPSPIDREKSGERMRTLAPRENFDMLLFEMTPAQFKTIQQSSLDDPKLLELMKAKRISFDMGNVVIQVAGKRKTITTAAEEFGNEVDTSSN